MSTTVLEKVETRGRPKLPENVIKDLEAEILRLKGIIATSNEPYEEMARLAEMLRIIQRAMKGLSPEENDFQGLINVKDIRERTRLENADVLSHSAMRLAKDIDPLFGFFNKIADMEDPYFISEDGEGRKEAILQAQAKAKLDTNMVLNMPNTQGGPAQNPEPTQPPKKGSFFNKVFKR